jgi:hypothetical protein
MDYAYVIGGMDREMTGKFHGMTKQHEPNYRICHLQNPGHGYEIGGEWLAHDNNTTNHLVCSVAAGFLAGLVTPSAKHGCSLSTGIREIALYRSRRTNLGLTRKNGTHKA